MPISSFHVNHRSSDKSSPYLSWTLLYVYVILLVECKRNKCILFIVEIAVVFNFILLVILIYCFCAVIPQPVVDTFFFFFFYYYYPWVIPYKPTLVNRTELWILTRLHALQSTCPGQVIPIYQEYCPDMIEEI